MQYFNFILLLLAFMLILILIILVHVAFFLFQDYFLKLTEMRLLDRIGKTFICHTPHIFLKRLANLRFHQELEFTSLNNFMEIVS